MHKVTLNFEDRLLEQQYQDQKLNKIRKPMYYATFIFFLLNGFKIVLEIVNSRKFKSEINVFFCGVQALMALAVIKKKQNIKIALVVTNIVSGLLQMNFNDASTTKQEFYSYGQSYAVLQAIGYFISDFIDGIIQVVCHLIMKITITSLYSERVDPMTISLSVTTSFFIILTIYVSDYNSRKQFISRITDGAWDRQLPHLIKEPFIKFTYNDDYLNVISYSKIEKFIQHNKELCFGCNAREFLKESKIRQKSLYQSILTDQIQLNTDLEAHFKSARFIIRVCEYGLEKLNRIVILRKLLTKETPNQLPLQIRLELQQTLKQCHKKFKFLKFYNWGIQSCLLMNNRHLKTINLINLIRGLNKTYMRFLTPIRFSVSSTQQLLLRTYSNQLRIYLFQIYHILIQMQLVQSRLIEISVHNTDNYVEFIIDMPNQQGFFECYKRNLFIQTIEPMLLWERMGSDLHIMFSKQIAFS